MKQEVLDYLKTQTICVLAVEMNDGSPHGATVHFAHNEDPFMFFFETDREYRKSEPLLKKEVTRATLVIGVDEKNKITFQLDGEVRLLKEDEKELFNRVYFSKFPNKEKKIADPNSLFFVFIPTWWRFTDYTTPHGKIVFTSN